MAARAKWFECVNQFVIIHFIDRRVNCAAAPIRVAQELQHLVAGIAGKILSGLEAGSLEIVEKLTKRVVGHFAIHKPANDLRHQRAPIEVGLQSASNVAGSDLRFRPLRHGVLVWSEGSAKLRVEVVGTEDRFDTEFWSGAKVPLVTSVIAVTRYETSSVSTTLWSVQMQRRMGDSAEEIPVGPTLPPPGLGGIRLFTALT